MTCHPRASPAGLDLFVALPASILASRSATIEIVATLLADLMRHRQRQFDPARTGFGISPAVGSRAISGFVKRRTRP